MRCMQGRQRRWVKGVINMAYSYIRMALREYLVSGAGGEPQPLTDASLQRLLCSNFTLPYICRVLYDEALAESYQIKTKSFIVNRVLSSVMYAFGMNW